LQIVFTVLGYISYVIFYATIAIASLLVLRVIVAWAGVNPFGWLPFHLRRVTEPLVRPLRQPFSGYTMRFDLLPLVAAATILFAGLFAGYVYDRIIGIFHDVFESASNHVMSGRRALVWVILLSGVLYEAAIFLRIILPWFGLGYGSRVLRFAFRITEPLLRPIRRLLGRYLVISMFDFSAFLALILVRVVTGLLADLVARW
jgi:YggT family protein